MKNELRPHSNCQRMLLSLIMENLPIVAVDLGGTLEDSWESKRAWFRENGIELGRFPREREEVISMIRGDVNLYEKMVEDVYSDLEVLKHPLVPGAKHALSLLSTKFNIIILSSRKKQQQNLTYRWLHLNRIDQYICETVLIGDVIKSGPSHKLRWCEKRGVTALIDDDIRHLNAYDCALSVKRIYLRLNPDNRIVELRNISNFYVAKNWKGIVTLLLGAK